MSAGHELIVSWELIPALEQQVASQGTTLEQQASWLSTQIDKLAKQNSNGWIKEHKMEALSKLSLLSEMYAIADFDKMVEAREKFQHLFPDHFSEFLSRLDSLSRQILWPGCLDCRNFDSKCTIDLSPIEVMSGSLKLEKYCNSKEQR